MEQAIQEHEAAVSRVYGHALEILAEEGALTEHQEVVYAVEHLMQEANSGASFEQYFRWADLSEISRITQILNGFGLGDIATLTTEAINIGFPDGIPKTEDEKVDLTEWTEDEEAALESLFERLEVHNGRVTNVLGSYILRVGV